MEAEISNSDGGSEDDLWMLCSSIKTNIKIFSLAVKTNYHSLAFIPQE